MHGQVWVYSVTTTLPNWKSFMCVFYWSWLREYCDFFFTQLIYCHYFKNRCWLSICQISSCVCLSFISVKKLSQSIPRPVFQSSAKTVSWWPLCGVMQLNVGSANILTIVRGYWIWNNQTHLKIKPLLNPRCFWQCLLVPYHVSAQQS